MNKLKKCLAMGMACVMLFSMAACSDGKKENNGDGSAAEKANNAKLAKEYVYRAKEIKLSSGEDSDMDIISSRRVGDQVEMLASEYIYSETENSQEITLYTMNMDGADVKSTKLEKPDSGSFGDQPVPNDGEMVIFDGAQGDASSDVDIPFEVSEETELGESDFYDEYPGPVEDYTYEYSNYSNAVLAEKHIFALLNRHLEIYSSSESTYEQSTEVCCWDKQGKLLWTAPFDMTAYQNDDEWSYISCMIPGAGDSVSLILSGNKNGIINVSSDGAVSALKKSAADRDVFSKDVTVVLCSDGTALLTYYNDDWTKQYICTYDAEKDSLGQEYEIPATARAQGFYGFSAGENYDVLYSNNEGVFGFNLGDTEVAKVMDYVNSDIVTYGMNNLISIDQERFIASYYDQTDYSNHYYIFTYVKPEDIQDKKTIIYAGVGIDTDQRADAIRFNKSNDQYRIVIKDYNSYNTEEDWTQGLTRLNNDIIAGNIPDVLLVSGNLPFESYVAKGLFANIDEMIQNDEELSKLEYMDNVFEAFRTDGVLYRIVSNFTVNTWVAKKSLVGEPTNWTMDEVKQAATKLNGEKIIFGGDVGILTREYFITLLMNYCGNDFVDLSTGKCNFDTKLFVDFLEYAKTLPNSENLNYDEDYWENYWQTYYSQFRENRALLRMLQLSDLRNAKYGIKGYMGEPVNYIGFPTESGEGSFVNSYESYAIFAKSENKEGAWQFLRTFLTEEYQVNEDNKYGYHYGMPVLKRLVREQADNLMERPYWEDENGNKNYYDDMFWMGDDSIVIEPFTKEEADQLFDFVCSIKRRVFYDENVMNIISEEAGSFFSGSMSAQDVAAKIQNRVQLYVNENR